MNKYVCIATMFALLGVAAVAFFAWENTLVAMLCTVLAAAISFLMPPTLGDVPPPGERRENLDPAELKRYPREHPGSTMGDAMREPQENSPDQNVGA